MSDAVDDPAVRHRERLWPSPGVWCTAPALGLLSGLALAVVVPPWAALTTAVAVTAAALVALARTSAIVEVSAASLRAGRARIPLTALGRVAVLDAERMRALRGVDADARAYLCQRGWLRRGVVVEVVDPTDPTPYWLLSSRQPERLAAAVRSTPGEPFEGFEDGWSR
ncbi:DUF3093 domain-containing protein [Angustibacter aerolatus]|uniref:DUF3093 domain-containing protein n=1 Tax=Angustibacter aerolatus TaxID=1162965 RepID=A0ABQ6JEG1_9ACTN|nr:DUF3093 domain-containing protein [Angustibacter aerolatus]GMA85292.1 hypothetical protein GCM10025868_05420 [Angustibacter aerolatus]